MFVEYVTQCGIVIYVIVIYIIIIIINTKFICYGYQNMSICEYKIMLMHYYCAL